MNNTKLINVLRTFSKTEMKEFEKLVSSSYFNRGRNYLPFLNELKKFYPKFDNEEMTPRYIYSKIYSTEKFNQQIVWNLTSGLLKMAEEFLIINAVKSNNFTANQMLAEQYHGRKLSSYYKKTIDDMEKKLEKIGMSDEYFQVKSLLALYKKVYNFLEDTQHLVPRYVAEKGEYTILNFLRSISGVIGDMDSNTKMYNAHFDTNLPHTFIRNFNFEELIKYAKAKSFRYTWVMEMCYHSIMLVLEPDSTLHYTDLKKLVMENFAALKRAERSYWLTSLTNHCVYMSADHSEYFRRELFELNKFYLKEAFVLEENYLSKISFVQILRNALSINETRWAESFIEEYIPMLKPSYQKTFRALAEAFLSINLKDYNKVIERLSKVRFVDNRDKYYVRLLSIRAYYELGEIPTLVYYIESSKQFISKNPGLGAETKNRFNDFLKYLNRLLLLKEKNDTDGIGGLKREIEKDKRVINGSWLIEKINELKLK